MTKKAYKLRASFSVLRMWEQGRWEDAIKAYFKMDRYISKAMAEGKTYHEEWAKETLKTGRLPAIFGGQKLKKPIVEKYERVKLYDWLDLSGVLDCYDDGVIYEYKTGVSNSQEYARTYQVPVYAVLSLALDLPVKKAEIHHYNQHDKTVDMSIIWVTDKTVKEGLDYIQTHGAEMHNYFIENNLYAELGEGIDGKGALEYVDE